MAQSLVSIRELRTRLSHFLRLVRKGESVVITNRGLPIGRIVPIEHHLDQRDKHTASRRSHEKVLLRRAWHLGMLCEYRVGTGAGR